MCDCTPKNLRFNPSEQVLYPVSLDLQNYDTDQEGTYEVAIPLGYRYVSRYTVSGEDVDAEILAVTPVSLRNNGDVLGGPDGAQAVIVHFKVLDDMGSPWVVANLLLERGVPARFDSGTSATPTP